MAEEDFVEAARFDSPVEAGKAAADLIENGVASQVVEVVEEPEGDAEEPTSTSAAKGWAQPWADAASGDVAPTSPPETPPARPTQTHYSLQVLPVDLERALAVLGIEERHVPEGTDDEPPKLEKVPTPWGRILLIWLIAMITIPAAAFLFAYYAQSR